MLGRRKTYFKFVLKGHISAVTLAFSFISQATCCVEHVVRLYEKVLQLSKSSAQNVFPVASILWSLHLHCILTKCVSLPIHMKLLRMLVLYKQCTIISLFTQEAKALEQKGSSNMMSGSCQQCNGQESSQCSRT